MGLVRQGLIVIFIFFILILSMFTSVISVSGSRVMAAEDQSQTDTEEEVQSDKEETVHLRADHLNYKENKIIVRDNVKITKGDTILESAIGEIFKEENRAVLRETVTANYNEGMISSDLMTAWLDEDRYVFEDNVKLEHNLENGRQMNLQSPFLEMFTADNSFNASGGVIIDYNQRRLKSQIASYNGSDQMLIMEEEVYIEEDGDLIKSNKAQFFLGSEEEEFEAEGNVELEFNIEENNN